MFHERPPSLEQIRAPAGRLDGVDVHVSQRQFAHFTRRIRALRRPVTEARTEPVRHRTDLQPPDQLRDRPLVERPAAGRGETPPRSRPRAPETPAGPSAPSRTAEPGATVPSSSARAECAIPVPQGPSRSIAPRQPRRSERALRAAVHARRGVREGYDPGLTWRPAARGRSAVCIACGLVVSSMLAPARSVRGRGPLGLAQIRHAVGGAHGGSLMKRTKTIGCILLALTLGSAVSLAQNRSRVAVLDFEFASISRWWEGEWDIGGGDRGHAGRRAGEGRHL